MMLKVHQGNFQNGGGMCACHQITLEHIGAVGTYISLVFPKIWIGDEIFPEIQKKNVNFPPH